MFEDCFLQMLRQYPDAVSDRKRLLGLLKDFFPEQPREVNLLTTAYDLGLPEELNKVSLIDSTFAFRFVKRLQDEYGISRAHGDWAVSIWCTCYGKGLLGKPCDIEIHKEGSGHSPSIRGEPGNEKRDYKDLFLYQALPQGYAIRGYSGPPMPTLIVPGTHQGEPVTRILACAFEGSEVQGAIITEGIHTIEKNAFRECKNLTQVYLPGTIQAIEDNVFSGCPNLATLSLPKSLERIGDYAFAQTALREIALPDTLKHLGKGAFKGCSKLTQIQLPKQLKEIPAEGLLGCCSLKKIELPEGLQAIGREAFSGCSGFYDFTVPQSVEHLGDNAFAKMGPSFCLLCYRNSAAHKYALAHKIRYQLLLSW